MFLVYEMISTPYLFHENCFCLFQNMLNVNFASTNSNLGLKLHIFILSAVFYSILILLDAAKEVEERKNEKGGEIVL